MRYDTKAIRETIIDVAYQKQEGHIASSLSVVEILYTLYKKVLTGDDYVILSKGHAALGYYVVLYHFGYITEEELFSFCETGSALGGHPDRTKVPGVLASTGSLGHGLPMAVGLALALRAQKRPGVVYCVIGDGERHEGSTLECLHLVPHHMLTNLCCIIDQNHSLDRALPMVGFDLAYAIMGWDVVKVAGHSVFSLEQALLRRHPVRPSMVIAETTKGKGVAFMEDNQEWHHKPLSDKDYALAQQCLENVECVNNL